MGDVGGSFRWANSLKNTVMKERDGVMQNLSLRKALLVHRCKTTTVSITGCGQYTALPLVVRIVRFYEKEKKKETQLRLVLRELQFPHTLRFRSGSTTAHSPRAIIHQHDIG
jgi:hypothetical protein